jgi:hypothetical protein
LIRCTHGDQTLKFLIDVHFQEAGVTVSSSSVLTSLAFLLSLIRNEDGDSLVSSEQNEMNHASGEADDVSDAIRGRSHVMLI